MANQKICDCCGKPGAHSVEVSTVMEGVVVDGSPTGCSHVMDVCPDCRPAETAKLHERVRAQIERDIPIHKEVIERRGKIGDLTKIKDAAVMAREQHAENTPEYKKADVAVDEAMKSIADNDDSINALLESAK